MARLSNDELSSVIAQIYDCALDPAQWVPTLQRLSGIFDACAGIIGRQGIGRTTPQYAWGVSPEVIDAYQRAYFRLNPLLTMNWHFEVGEPITVDRFMDPDDLRKTKFYHEFLQPAHWFDMLSVLLEKSADDICIISFPKALDAPAPSQDDRDLIRLLAPHFRRAVTIHDVLSRNTARADDLAATLDQLPTPVLLFDADGTCIETNAAARHFLADSDVLYLNAGQLRARGGQLDHQLATVLNNAQGSRDPIDQATTTFAFSQNNGRSFAAHVMPLAAGLRDRIGRNGLAVRAMFIQPVGETQPLPGEVLVKLYGLTPAETRLIALLGQGCSLEESAATLGIAMPTARTHLQRIFQKTNTTRQSQVVKLVMSALPGPPG